MTGFNPNAKGTNTNETNGNGTTQPPAGGLGGQGLGGDKKPTGILGGNAFFGNTTNNPTITRVIDLLRTWCREQNEQNLEIVPIEGSLRGLRMSGIALAYPWASATLNENVYLTQYILFEETLPERGNLYTTEVNNQQVQVTVTADDWVTADFLKRLEEVVSIGVKKPGTGIRTVGFNIVNREISARPNESQAYIRLVQQAGECFAQYIEYVLGEHARNKNTVKDILNGRSLSLNVDTSGIPAFNHADQPVRNDFALTISAKERAEGTANGLFDTGIIPLTQTTGFIDVTYYEQTDAERLNAQFGAQYDPSAQYRRFTAAAVITDIQSLRGIWEVDSIVNAFLSVVALTENRQWAALLQRRFSNSSGARLRDVGALALEVDPQGGVIDTASTQYDEYRHANTINAFFRPRFDFQIDLPRQSAFGFFRQLLRGSVDVGSASYKAFVKALHEYTNENFPLNFNDNILVLDPRPVLLGSYSGGNNGLGATRHDIRDYEDYLTVLTQVGETDLNTVKDFDAALAGVNGKTLEERTTTVLNIVERMAGEVVLTGKADRYTINPRFLETLVGACKAANLTIQTRTIGQMASTVSNRRSADNLVGAGFNMTQSVFNTNTGGGLGTSNVGGGLNLGFGVL